jgi:hypothetical protein
MATYDNLREIWAKAKWGAKTHKDHAVLTDGDVRFVDSFTTFQCGEDHPFVSLGLAETHMPVRTPTVLRAFNHARKVIVKHFIKMKEPPEEWKALITERWEIPLTE